MKLVEVPLALKPLRPVPPALIRVAMVLWVAAVCVVMVVLNVSWYRQMQREAELSRYRVAVRDIAGTLRAMQARAVGQREALELRIDAASGALSLSTAPRRGRRYARLERTIWLPDGLQINEAPEVFSAQTNGVFTAGSLTLVAPAYRRLFRLKTSARGMVELYEEPTS